MILMRTLVLCVSFIGYYLFYLQKIKKHAAYFPIVITSFITVMIYAFGVAERLLWGAYLAVGLGILALAAFLFFYIFRKERISFKAAFLNTGFLFFAVSMVWLFIITRNTYISHVDDVSHWYRIAKMMHAEKAYPTQPDNVFPSYLPGTATWIFYLTRFINFTLPNCYFSQGVINVAACTALFAAVPEKAGRRKKIWSLVLVATASVILCGISVSTYSLLVDTVVALVPMAGAMLLFDAALSGNKADLPDAAQKGKSGENRTVTLVFFILVLMFGVLIKTSGLLFTVFSAVAWYKWNDGARKKGKVRLLIESLLLIIIPFVYTRLYLSRSKRIYGSFSSSNQGLSLERYTRIFGEKTPELLRGITGKYLSELLPGVNCTPQVRIVWICLAGLAVILMVMKVVKAREDAPVRNVRRTFRFLLFCTLIYSLSLLLTYMFSMRGEEATGTYLVAFYRYFGAISVYVYGMTVASLLREAVRDDSYGGLVLPVFTVLTFFIGTSLFSTSYIFGYDRYEKYDDYSNVTWKFCSEAFPEGWEYNEKTYAVIWDPDSLPVIDTGKIPYLITTYVRSMNVDTYKLPDVVNGTLSEEEKAAIGDHDYLITLGDYSFAEDSIRQYINIDDYHQGLCEVRASE